MSGDRGPVSPLLAAKLALVAGGIATFGVGIRVDNVWIRWAGIGIVAIVWILRFAKRPRPANEGTETGVG